MKRTVLVLGDHQQTIAVVRSLGRAGWSVIVGQHGRRPFSSLSRYARAVWHHPDPDQRAAFGAALRAFVAENPDVRWVFPVGESELLAVADCREGLSARLHVAMPSVATLRACLNKPQSFRIAGELGIPQVPTVVVSNYDEMLAAADSIRLPLAVKCPDSTRLINEHKAITCRDHASLAALRRARYPLIVQRWFSGIRHNCQFAARDGALIAYFQQAVVRTDAADGTGFGIEGMSVAPSPELRAHCAALVQRLGYDGVGCVQFLVNEARGECMFLELNPRLDATCELAVRCGIDLPRLAVEPTAATPAEYPVGRRFHWLLGDLRSIGHRLKASGMSRAGLMRELRGAAAAHWRADHRLTWSWADPLPTLYLYAHAVVVGGRNYVHAAGMAARSH